MCFWRRTRNSITRRRNSPCARKAAPIRLSIRANCGVSWRRANAISKPSLQSRRRKHRRAESKRARRSRRGIAGASGRPASMMFGPDAGEYRAEQEYLHGVVDPGEQHDHAACRPVTGADMGGAEIESDQIFADVEQDG